MDFFKYCFSHFYLSKESENLHLWLLHCKMFYLHFHIFLCLSKERSCLSLLFNVKGGLCRTKFINSRTVRLSVSQVFPLHKQPSSQVYRKLSSTGHATLAVHVKWWVWEWGVRQFFVKQILYTKADQLRELVITMSEVSLKKVGSRIIEPSSVIDCYKIWNIIGLQRHLNSEVIGNLIAPSAKQEDSHQ